MNWQWKITWKENDDIKSVGLHSKSNKGNNEDFTCFLINVLKNVCCPVLHGGSFANSKKTPK